MLKLYGAIALLLLLSCGGIFAYLNWGPGNSEKVEMTLSILKSEPMNFLVTRRLCTTVVLDKEENSVWLGSRRGLLIADVELLYGFDLSKLDKTAIRVEGNKLIVKLPPPELLRTVVEPGTMRYFTKQSNLSLLADKITNQDLRDELNREFTRAARLDFERKALIPSDADLRESLRTWATPLFKQSGLTVIFE